jgi:hypothetical protein
MCIDEACRNLIDPCRADPECASYLDCVLACPAGATGLPDVSCIDACPVPANEVGAAARVDFDLCLQGSAGCSECGHVSPADHPFPNEGCPTSSQTNACLKCWLEGCCETADRCFTQNVECGLLFDCLVECDSPTVPSYSACTSDCFAAHPDGVADYLMDYSCTDLVCTRPGPCDTTNPTACDLCVREHCGGTNHACNIDPGCHVIKLCISECFDEPNCVESCLADADASALEQFELDRVCVLAECSSECVSN